MKKEIKRLLGCIRKADRDFGLIAPGDHILIGVSGGKDSLLLTLALRRYQQFMGNTFALTAGTLAMGEMDTSAIAAFCEALEVPYLTRPSNILEVVFQTRREKNPCSLCAKLRRGMLVTWAKELGCNKIALGHHRDDAIETFLLSLFYEGRMHTFSPSTYLDRSGITQIRPMVYVEERSIVSLAQQLELPVQRSNCPRNGYTKRQEVKELIQRLRQEVRPDIDNMLFSALENTEGYSLWHKVAGDEPASKAR